MKPQTENYLWNSSNKIWSNKMFSHRWAWKIHNLLLKKTKQPQNIEPTSHWPSCSRIQTMYSASGEPWTETTSSSRVWSKKHSKVNFRKKKGWDYTTNNRVIVSNERDRGWHLDRKQIIILSRKIRKNQNRCNQSTQTCWKPSKVANRKFGILGRFLDFSKWIWSTGKSKRGSWFP